MTPSDVRPSGASRPSPKRRLTSRSCLLVVLRLAAGDLFFLLPFAPLPGADSAAAAASPAPPGADSVTTISPVAASPMPVVTAAAVAAGTGTGAVTISAASTVSATAV